MSIHQVADAAAYLPVHPGAPEEIQILFKELLIRGRASSGPRGI